MTPLRAPYRSDVVCGKAARLAWLSTRYACNLSLVRWTTVYGDHESAGERGADTFWHMLTM